MRIIVSGWRKAGPEHRSAVEHGLYRFLQTYEPAEVTLVHGDGTGVDQLAAELARLPTAASPQGRPTPTGRRSMAATPVGRSDGE